MKFRFAPAALRGITPAPPSISIAHRALLCSALSAKRCTVSNLPRSRDVYTTISCLKTLGCGLHYGHNSVTFTGSGSLPSSYLNCQESQTTLRFIIPVVAALGIPSIIYGEESLPETPISAILELLAAHKVEHSYYGGRLPLRINSRLPAGEWRISGDIGSQFLTGMMLAAPLAAQIDKCDVRIYPSSTITARAYIDMTMDVMKQFGIKIYESSMGFVVQPGQKYTPRGDFAIEGDYSAAANILCAAAVSGGVEVTGLSHETDQTELELCEVLKMFGAYVFNTPSGVNVKKSPLTAIDIDASKLLSVVPPLTVVAASAEGTSVFRNISHLKYKRGDRLEALIDLISVLGGDIDYRDGNLYVTGKQLHGGEVCTYGDPRIAMAAAIAALNANGSVIVDDPLAAEKAYPYFYDVYRKLGGLYEVIEE